jgi:hypothetical protein
MFRSKLFQKSWHDVHAHFQRQAIADVEQLDEKMLFDPQLAGAFQRIVAKYTFQVAKLDSQPGTAKPTKFDTGRASVDALNVPIPFTGDAVSFEISPPHSNVISPPDVEVQKGQVIVTVYEQHGNPGQEILDFIERSNENLDRLREEVKRYDGELLKTVTQSAERRKSAIEERRKRDEKLPFRVDRS